MEDFLDRLKDSPLGKPFANLFGFVNTWWQTQGMDRIVTMALFLSTPAFMKTTALIYIIGSQLVPLTAGLTVLYFVNKLVYRPTKKVSDPTNVDLFDRALAFLGLLVPYVELAHLFPKQLAAYPELTQFINQFVGGIRLVIEYNPYLILVWNFLVFRELIRRRGPDTVWAGLDKKKYWIKWFIRYYWCYGFCLTSLIEPYNFINSKIFDLLVMSPWFSQSVTYFVFYVTGALLLYGAIGILVGVPNYVPLLHGACVFHVGKPKADR